MTAAAGRPGPRSPSSARGADADALAVPAETLEGVAVLGTRDLQEPAERDSGT